MGGHEAMNEGNMMRASEYAILYVDDEEMALKYFQRALGRNFTVHIAADAQAGLEILEAQGDNIGVLVSDQRMPGESGVELLKKVRRHWRSEEHTSELQSRFDLVCRLLLEKKKTE